MSLSKSSKSIKFLSHHYIEFLILYEFVRRFLQIPGNLQKMFVNIVTLQKTITE